MSATAPRSANYYINKYTMLKTNYRMIRRAGQAHSLEKIDNIGHRLFTTMVR
jgi:hypothetical protein